jgi:hypothetical protein
MVELIKRAVYLTDENLPTLAAQRPSAYGDEWLKPGAWGCRSEGSSDTRCAEVFALPERAIGRFALSPFRRFAPSCSLSVFASRFSHRRLPARVKVLPSLFSHLRIELIKLVRQAG